MKNAKQCAMCGKVTTKFLFNDKLLDIPICSINCEHEYFDTLPNNKKDQINILRYLDDLIEKNKRHGKIGWAISGFGLLIILIGFLIPDPTVFLVGVCPLTFGAISTRHFEDRQNQLIKLRKRILI
jgi:hypothetical protein